MKTLKKQIPAKYLVVGNYGDGILEQHVYANVPTLGLAESKLREFNIPGTYIVEIQSKQYEVVV